MANYKQKNDSGTKLYWAVTAVMLLTAMPVGIVMILFKLFEKKGQPVKSQVRFDTPLGARTTGGAEARVRQSWQEALAPLQKKSKHRIRWGGVLTLFFALVLTVVMGDAFPLLREDPTLFLSEIWFPLCAFAVSGAYALTGENLRKRLNRWRTYLSMMGPRRSIPVAVLAKAAGLKQTAVCRDLEALLDTGVFKEGFLDYSTGQFMLSSGGLTHTAPKPEAKPEPKQPDAADKENALLDEIRQVNDLVKNEKLSAQIDQIGLITAKILDYEKSHPASAPQLHSFLSYYLPTTLKILRAYGQLEAQEVSGGNITAAMVRIENMMDKVVEGFEKQLDQLFLGETMDITTDVEVLERMLAKDGLSGGQTFTLEF